jgi:two-component system, cell cycle response regulator DivK
MQILLIEDDDSIQEVFKIILETEAPIPGITVVTASNGFDAINLIESAKPDLVLLDLTLPEYDGFEVFEKLRSIAGASEIPVIAVTAHNLTSMRERALSMGFAGYVTKPINFEAELYPLLKKFLIKPQDHTHAA